MNHSCHLTLLIGLWCYSKECNLCQPGYYYHAGRCILKADLSKQNPVLGVDSGLGAQMASPCSEKACPSCTKKYSVCDCPLSNFYYFNDNQEFECVIGKIPQGYGKNKEGNSKRLEKCSIANCVKCDENYKECTECSENTYRKSKYPVSNCYTYANIPRNWGIDKGLKGENILKTCSAGVSCSICRDNYLACQKCLETHPYHKEAKAPFSECYEVSRIPDGFGIIKNQGELKEPLSTQIERCRMRACSSCQNDSVDCTKCSKNRFLKTNEAPKKKSCVACDQDGEWKEEKTGLCNQCHLSCRQQTN